MTLVDITTGEIVEFDAAAAERRAERISLRLDAIADNYRAVLPMIREAIEKRDDIALGYRSPGDYVSDRFGQALAGLGIEVRRAVVGELTEAGLSTRAIAPVVAASIGTVHNDQQVFRSEHLDETSDSEAQGNGAGTAFAEDPSPASPTAQQGADVDSVGSADGEGEGAPGAFPKPAPPAAPSCDIPAPITGIDGKTYRRPTPAPKPERSGEQQNAEENSRTLASTLIFLLAFQHPTQRDTARIEWTVGSSAVSPTSRDYVTPDRMRTAARGLLDLADEWESTHE